MTEAQARGLVAVLMAAFPRQSIEQPTRDLYATAMMRFASSTAAAEAVQTVIGSSHAWPSLAAIRETYAAAYRREQTTLEHERRELETITAGKRVLPETIREFVQGLRLRGMTDGEKKAKAKLAGLEQVGSGVCADCKCRAELARYGLLALCSRCVGSRVRVAVELEQQQRELTGVSFDPSKPRGGESEHSDHGKDRQ